MDFDFESIIFFINIICLFFCSYTENVDMCFAREMTANRMRVIKCLLKPQNHIFCHCWLFVWSITQRIGYRIQYKRTCLTQTKALVDKFLVNFMCSRRKIGNNAPNKVIVPPYVAAGENRCHNWSRCCTYPTVKLPLGELKKQNMFSYSLKFVAPYDLNTSETIKHQPRHTFVYAFVFPQLKFRSLISL